jgi:hypothetical protein
MSGTVADEHEDLISRVKALRARGRSPKEIASALGVRPAVVAALVRSLADHGADAAPEPAVVGCWVSAGWQAGLTVEGHPDWPSGDRGDQGEFGPDGLVATLVARTHRYGKVSICGWLVDVYCLGVKDVLGPRAIVERELPAFVERYFDGYATPPLPAPIELVQQLVWGSIEYARGLGFEPAAGFEASAANLGPLAGERAIQFGRDGKPFYVNGPHDDTASILRTLTATVGEGNFEFLAAGPALEPRPAGAAPAHAGHGGGSRRRPGDVAREGRQWRPRNR